MSGSKDSTMDPEVIALAEAHLRLTQKAAGMLAEEIGIEQYCWLMLKAFGVPAHEIPDNLELLVAKLAKTANDIMNDGVSDEHFYNMLSAIHKSGGPRVKQLIEAEGSVLAKLNDRLFRKTLLIDGVKHDLKIPYDTHCDECERHLPGDDRVGWCSLFEKRSLVCECGAPARLPACVDAECDGPCPGCGGDGQIHFLDTQSEARHETCERCQGTGRV